ncbi:hypothetical protein BV20DRAFT_1053278 [Pilatotrama ljubarskyi]|nr:hypothetical protein BV20DRAFT_1053278 [Pilatotrama ljubarskyi]
MTPPCLPDSLNEMAETQRESEMELYHRRVLHYHYAENTRKCNLLHYAALTDPVDALRRRLFHHARAPWEGETLPLKVALTQATENWETLVGEGVPCPIALEPDDVGETKKLDAEVREVDSLVEVLRDNIGVGPDDGVPAEHYEEAMVRNRKLKEVGLAAADNEEERALLAAHWPFDDMDEEDYM